MFNGMGDDIPRNHTSNYTLLPLTHTNSIPAATAFTILLLFCKASSVFVWPWNCKHHWHTTTSTVMGTLLSNALNNGTTNNREGAIEEGVRLSSGELFNESFLRSFQGTNVNAPLLTRDGIPFTLPSHPHPATRRCPFREGDGLSYRQRESWTTKGRAKSSFAGYNLLNCFPCHSRPSPYHPTHPAPVSCSLSSHRPVLYHHRLLPCGNNNDFIALAILPRVTQQANAWVRQTPTTTTTTVSSHGGHKLFHLYAATYILSTLYPPS